MIRRLLVAAAVLVNLAAFAPAPVYIANDLGGLTTLYNTRWLGYDRANTPIVIKGSCVSACARFMTLRNVCATPSGYFLLHAIRDQNERIRTAESILDSRRWENARAFALQQKYGVFGFGLQLEPPKRMTEVVEPGVSIVYYAAVFGRRTMYQKFLRVRASLLVRSCP